MNLPLVISPQADDDLVHAKQWYDDQGCGLGDEFVSRVEEAFEVIRRTPTLYGKVFQDLRLALTRRFPYAIVYRIDDDQITIVAVYHTRRDPRGWRRRV
jgi:plasmid stabilization system protein ParE